MNLLAAGDPLYADGVDLVDVGITALKVVVIFAFLLVATMMMIWFERKVVSDMQNRIGPNRAGPYGLLQSLADGIKAFFKEDLIPERADKRVFKLAPYLTLLPAFLAFAIIPIGGTVEIFGRETRLQLADPPMGVLFMLAVSSIAVYGVMLAGWASGSKYPLLGAVRASAQMVSYEAAMGLTIATVVLVTGALELSTIVGEQQQPLFADGPSWLHSWNILAVAVVPFVIFVIAATAELNRPPFDFVEAEQELVGGFNTEYSGIRFAMFFLAEFMNTITMSAFIIVLFLGGGDGPTWSFLPDWTWALLWFGVKLFCFLYAYVWVRGTLPRMRYDQLMDLGWKYLIPLSLGWMLVVAAMQVEVRYGLFTFAGLLVTSLVLMLAMNVGRSLQDEDAAADDFAAVSPDSSREVNS